METIKQPKTITITVIENGRKHNIDVQSNGGKVNQTDMLAIIYTLVGSYFGGLERDELVPEGIEREAYGRGN